MIWEQQVRDLKMSTSPAIMNSKDMTAPGAPGANLGRIYKKSGNEGLFWHANGGVETSLSQPGVVVSFGGNYNVSNSNYMRYNQAALAATASTITPTTGFLCPVGWHNYAICSI